MKSKNIILGSLGAIALASIVFLYPTKIESGVYESRVKVTNTNDAGLSSVAFDYYEMIRRNVETGKVDEAYIARAQDQVNRFISGGSRAALNFKDHGPDNIGGRTRAIMVDQNDYKHVYAGSVSGGLFESFNRGNVWKKVEGFDVNFGISSMCQTDDGTIYVATGHDEERYNGTTQGTGQNGAGVFYSNDGGATFLPIVGTEENTFINEIVSKGNSILIAGAKGMFEYDGVTLTKIGANGACTAMSISPDKMVVVAAFLAQKTYVSSDGGANFDQVSGNGVGEIPDNRARVEYAISHEKVDGKYYVYASMSEGGGGTLFGVFLSKDNGMTWSRIAPKNNGMPGSFAPFDAGGQSQGNYDQIITVVKGDPETCILGGIEVHAKSLSGNWEPRSSNAVPEINKLYVHSDQHEMTWDSEGRLWLGNDGGVFFSDDEGKSFRQANRGYNVTQMYRVSASAHGDVVGGTQDNGTLANYHDNHTYQEHKEISGGDGYACDFSFMNRDVIFSSTYYGLFFRTGDRGVNTLAVRPQNIPASLGTGGSLPPENLGSFYTVIELYENPKDLTSEDTVAFAPGQSFKKGDTIQVPSMTSQQFMTHVLTENITFQDSLYANPALTINDTIIYDTSGIDMNINLYEIGFTYVVGSAPVSVGDTLLIDGVKYGVDSITTQAHYFGTNSDEPGEVVDMEIYDFLENVKWDTVRIQDIYQSWLAFGLGEDKGLWLTRNSLRFADPHDGFLQVGGGMSGTVTEMEFSKDGDHLFVGTSQGELWRLSGLNQIYSPNTDIGVVGGNVPDTTIRWADNMSHTTLTTWENVNNFNGGPVTGITIEKGNPDNVVITLGGYNGGTKVQRSKNATSNSVTFSGLNGLPDMPCLSAVMDRNNPDVLFVGTDFGLYRTENASATTPTWEYCDAPFGQVPIFDIKQNWRTREEGSYKGGEIYIGTHGRGIWSTDEYLGLSTLRDNISMAKSISDLVIFPNPVANYANIKFEAIDEGQAKIKVYSITGRLVYENSLKVNEGNNQIDLNVDPLAKGTYIVNITAGNASKTAKFIKQ